MENELFGLVVNPFNFEIIVHHIGRGGKLVDCHLQACLPRLPITRCRGHRHRQLLWFFRGPLFCRIDRFSGAEALEPLFILK